MCHCSCVVRHMHTCICVFWVFHFRRDPTAILLMPPTRHCLSLSYLITSVHCITFAVVINRFSCSQYRKTKRIQCSIWYLLSIREILAQVWPSLKVIVFFSLRWLTYLTYLKREIYNNKTSKPVSSTPWGVFNCCDVRL
mgnify:CR=1 FL=1